LGGYAPPHGLVRAVFLGAEGHAQERSLFGKVLHPVRAGDLWIAARHFCPREFLCSVDTGGAVFIIRQPEGLPWERRNAFRSGGRIETGHVAEQRGQVWDAQGGVHLFRRIQVQRDQATRDGDRVLDILPNIPLRQAAAPRVARLSRTRWTLETAFPPLEADFHAAINT
jgi:hypothetical protein